MRRKRSPGPWWFALALCLLTGAGLSQAGPIRSGFAGGSIPASDDGSSGAVDLGFGVNFFGQTHANVYVNNNGNVTFGAPLDEFTPSDLSGVSHQIIAPYFADVDTSLGGSVTYGTGLVDGRSAFAATWSGVGYYLGNNNKANDFQVVLIDRGAGDFDIELNYDRIQWETGDFSGGVDGLGGSSARAGYAKGTGAAGTSHELPGSGVNGAFLDGGPAGTALTSGSLNSDIDGRYVFYGRDGTITTTPDDDPGTDPGGGPSVPEPATLIMAAAGLMASGVFARKRKK